VTLPKGFHRKSQEPFCGYRAPRARRSSPGRPAALPQLALALSAAQLFGAVTFFVRSFRSGGCTGKFVLIIQQVPGQITSRKTNLSIDNKYQIPPTASPEMHFGSLPVEILSLILPSHGKGACVAAQVCSSWRAFVQSQLLQVVAADPSLPMWCRRWQIADRSEANFAFATLCRINPHLLRFADVYDADDVLLSELDHKTLDVANHIQLGLPVGDNSFQFFTAGSFSSNSKCWNNLALFEFFFGDDLHRIESWWMLVETRLNAKQHGAFVLHSLNFGSTWQNLYSHAPLLSPEVIPTPHTLHFHATPFTRSFSSFVQACFLYLFHNGQLHGRTTRPTSCQAQPWHRSLVRSMPDSSIMHMYSIAIWFRHAWLAAGPEEEGFSPQMFSGLFGSYGVCVLRFALDFSPILTMTSPSPPPHFLQLQPFCVIYVCALRRCGSICHVNEVCRVASISCTLIL
jgi:hypothetical protein